MLKLKDITHIHSNGGNIAHKALDGVCTEINFGEFIIVLGQSGSGKTTLLNIIAGLLKPTQGIVENDGKDIYKLNNKDLSVYRKRNIGFIFQNYFLDNSFTSIENVLVPLFLQANITGEQRIQMAKDMLGSVGLGDKLFNRPTQLSGGECQRVAVARALVNSPSLLIADEPTGNLDSKNGDAIVNLLRQQVNPKRSVIMVTHNQHYVEPNDIVFNMIDGRLTHEKL